MHPLRLSVPFKKWAIPGHFFVFSSFQTNNTIHTTVKQCPSSKRCWDSNPWRFEHESLRITTRPRLPPDWVFFATANKRVSSIGSQQQQQQKQQKMKKFSLKRAFKHSHVTYLLTYLQHVASVKGRALTSHLLLNQFNKSVRDKLQAKFAKIQIDENCCFYLHCIRLQDILLQL